ncbi:Hypothetical protein NocV09_02600130 [Nannochloropsis oceanica]
MQGQQEGLVTIGSESGVCQQCRLSRVRCDRIIPCPRCQRMGLECVPQSRGRGRPRVIKSEGGGGSGSGDQASARPASGAANPGGLSATMTRRPTRRMVPARWTSAGASSKAFGGLQQEQGGETAGRGEEQLFRNRHNQQQRQERPHVATNNFAAARTQGCHEKEQGAEAEVQKEKEGSSTWRAGRDGGGDYKYRARMAQERVQGGGGAAWGTSSFSSASSAANPSSPSSSSSSSKSSRILRLPRYRKSDRGNLLLEVSEAKFFNPVMAHAATGMLIAAINRVRVAGKLCQRKAHALLRTLGARAMRRPDYAGRELLEMLSAMLKIGDWAKHLFGPKASMPPLVPLRPGSGVRRGHGEGVGERAGGGSRAGDAGDRQAMLSPLPQTEQRDPAPQQDFLPLPLHEVERAQLAEVEADLKSDLLWTVTDGVPHSYAVTTAGLSLIRASEEFTELFPVRDRSKMVEGSRQEAVLPCFLWASRLVPADQLGFFDTLASTLLTTGGREKMSMVGKCVDGRGKIFLALIRYQLMMRKEGRDAMEAFSCQRLPPSQHVVPSSEEEEEEEEEEEVEEEEEKEEEEWEERREEDERNG